jgi:hypothetical protein
MTGMKFKLAHRRADKGTWSASVQAQRRHLIRILKQVADDLEREAAANEAKATRAKAPGHARPRTVTSARKHSRAA